jgi:hypothetical protein
LGCRGDSSSRVYKFGKQALYLHFSESLSTCPYRAWNLHEDAQCSALGGTADLGGCFRVSSKPPVPRVHVRKRIKIDQEETSQEKKRGRKIDSEPPNIAYQKQSRLDSQFKTAVSTGISRVRFSILSLCCCQLAKFTPLGARKKTKSAHKYESTKILTLSTAPLAETFRISQDAHSVVGLARFRRFLRALQRLLMYLHFQRKGGGGPLLSLV